MSNYPTEVTDDDPYFTDESEENLGEEIEWGCLFPDKCLMPSDHMTSECQTWKNITEP